MIELVVGRCRPRVSCSSWLPARRWGPPLQRLRDTLRTVNLRRPTPLFGIVEWNYLLCKRQQNAMTVRSEQTEARHAWRRARWVQLNVGLVRAGGLALTSARALFDRITPLIEDWRGAAKLRWFFFMRKPPDVRLRFLVRTDLDVRPVLSTAMSELQQANFVREYYYSGYEAEAERFGGPDGMSSVHEHFDADTAAWLRLDRLERKGRRSVSPDDLMPALVQDLFLSACIHDAALVATSWQRLWDLIATPASPPLPEVSRELLKGLSRLGAAHADERECLELCSSANGSLARNLNELASNGKLDGELTDVLATVALFTFHRHGFAGHRSSPLVAATMNALQIEYRDTRQFRR